MANYYVDTDGVSQTYASLAAALAALPAPKAIVTGAPWTCAQFDAVIVNEA